MVVVIADIFRVDLVDALSDGFSVVVIVRNDLEFDFGDPRRFADFIWHLRNGLAEVGDVMEETIYFVFVEYAMACFDEITDDVFGR